jgi:hypothetical protein
VSAKVVRPDGGTIELDSGAKDPGRYKLTWSGVDPAGVGAPEGVYHWNVTATDDLGRASTDDRHFSIDNTLGFLHASAGARRIGFTLIRDADIQVIVQTPGGNILRMIEAGSRPAGTQTVPWDGRDARHRRVARGNYVVRVAARSVIGRSELRVPVRVVR